MADVFISYASEDRPRIRPLAEALQERGFSVWWDRSLAAGHDYAAVIERELKNAKAVIVVWTQSSSVSTFVRDEAGRARDAGRLVPVLLDPVQLPLGFGAFQAEDFTRWNGGANAPQMQILDEALRAKIEGRDVNAEAVARKRRRLMSRIRIVSVLTVIALLVGIAVGGKYLFDPPEAAQPDLRAELLRLLEEGKLTPDQAIELARILESGALGEGTQLAEGAPAPEQGAAGPPAATMRAETAPGTGDATVSEAAFEATARDTYREAVGVLLRHPNADVRRATLELSNASTRERAMQTMWAYAQANPEDPNVAHIYLICGAVGETNEMGQLGQRALEAAASVAPQDPSTWRMLSRSYRRQNRPVEAQAAAQVGDGVEVAATDPAAAEQQLQRALPQLAPQVAAPVAAELGDLAVRRDDWTGASARYERAYRLREQTAREAPGAPATQALEADAQSLVLALARSGRTREACERLRQAQEAHDVATPNEELLQQCQREFRVQLRPQVQAAPQLRERRLAPAQPPAERTGQ